MAKNRTHGEWDSAFRGRNVRPSDLTADLSAGDVRHGLSDGSWDLIDLLSAIAGRAGPETVLDLAVWTASGVHGRRLAGFIRSGRVKRVRLAVDRSFQSRQPAACETLRETFGDRRAKPALDVCRDTESDTGSDTLPGQSVHLMRS